VCVCVWGSSSCENTDPTQRSPNMPVHSSSSTISLSLSLPSCDLTKHVVAVATPASYCDRGSLSHSSTLLWLFEGLLPPVSLEKSVFFFSSFLCFFHVLFDWAAGDDFGAEPKVLGYLLAVSDRMQADNELERLDMQPPQGDPHYAGLL